MQISNLLQTIKRFDLLHQTCKRCKFDSQPQPASFWEDRSVLLKTLATLATVPPHPYFLHKLAEHITLTPFAADLSESRKIHLVRFCEIDEGRNMQNFVSISAFDFELSKQKYRTMFRPAPPLGASYYITNNKNFSFASFMKNMKKKHGQISKSEISERPK